MEMNVCCGAGPPSWNLRRHAAITPRAATPENVETIVARGRGLWASIYEPHAEKLYNKLGGYHPDFIGECPPDPDWPSAPRGPSFPFSCSTRHTCYPCGGWAAS